MKFYIKTFVYLMIFFNLIFLISAQGINSKGITSITEELDHGLVFDKIQKIYELSDSSLEKGYSAILNEKDAFRINIKEKNYYM